MARISEVLLKARVVISVRRAPNALMGVGALVARTPEASYTLTMPEEEPQARNLPFGENAIVVP